MKISKETAQAAIDGLTPANMQEYYEIANYCSKGGSEDGPMTMGRVGLFLAFGERLKKDGAKEVDGKVDISMYKEAIDADEAFSKLRIRPKK